MVSIRSYTPWIRLPCQRMTSFPSFPSGVTFLGTVLPGKTDVKKPSVQLVPFHILCHKVLTHAAGPHSPLAFFFLRMSLYKPIFCPLCHSPDSVQMASGTFKFIPPCPNSGSRCRSQFCICYVIPHSLSYVIKKIDFPRATWRISFKISFLFTLWGNNHVIHGTWGPINSAIMF